MRDKIFRFFSNGIEYCFPYTEQGYKEMCYFVYTRNLIFDKCAEVIKVSSDKSIIVLTDEEKSIIEKEWTFYSELFAR